MREDDAGAFHGYLGLDVYSEFWQLDIYTYRWAYRAAIESRPRRFVYFPNLYHHLQSVSRSDP